MKLQERITQLAKLDIPISTSEFEYKEARFEFRTANKKKDLDVKGNLIVRFDGGEGFETILGRESGFYTQIEAKIFSAELGERGIGSRIYMEIHQIYDLSTKMIYEFKLPSRTYFK